MKPQNTLNTRKDFLFEKESYAIRGAVFDVYRTCSFFVYSVCSVVNKKKGATNEWNKPVGY